MDREWLEFTWKFEVARGIIGILFGIVAMIWPVETVIALAILWGIWALIDGIGSIALAFLPDARQGRGWLIFMGVIAIVAAFFAILSPEVAAATLMWILGIWLIVRGLFELVGAFGVGGGLPMWLMLAGAAISILIGVLFVWRPGGSAVALAVWLGICAVVWGVISVGAGLQTRRELKYDDTANNEAATA
jgi:uncharacterized membrane protein HdeD (DUF308 family)